MCIRDSIRPDRWAVEWAELGRNPAGPHCHAPGQADRGSAKLPDRRLGTVLRRRFVLPHEQFHLAGSQGRRPRLH